MNQISPELLNGFAPNSHGRRVWSLAQASLNVKGHGHQGQKMHCALSSPPAVTEWNALAANVVMQQQTGPFLCCRGCDFGSLCVFMFGKISLALVSDAFLSVNLQLLWAVISRVPLIRARI